jgi:hypothetical protein
MEFELVLIAAAVAAFAGILARSPLARAICWDSFVHAKDRCDWEKDGDRLREVKETDHPVEA